MIFRCPCGYVNDIYLMPEDNRVKCAGCRKVWVVSKKGKKRSRVWRDSTLGAALLATLVPGLWPMAPVLLVGLGARIFLLPKRYRIWARVGLAGLMAVVWGMAAAMALALGVMIAGWVGGRGPAGHAGAGELGGFCLGARIWMDEWGWVGWVGFGLLIVFAGVAPIIAKHVKFRIFDRGRRIAQVALTVLAAVGPMALLGHVSVDGLATAAERTLQDRYVAATARNRAEERRTALVNTVAGTFAGDISADDKAAFTKALGSITSATDAAGMDEWYLLGPGFAKAHGDGSNAATTRPGEENDESADVLWHAMTMKRWSAEADETAAAESAGPGLDRARAEATHDLLQVAARHLGRTVDPHVDAIDAYFTGTVNFALAHFSAGQIDRGMEQIAKAICRLSAARELNIRDTVAKLYQQAVVANSIVPWQPTSQARSQTAKTIIIRNDSSEEVTFWVVGPIVKEVDIAPGYSADVPLDESNYRAIVSAGSATPTVLELGYGSGRLSGVVTKEGTWVED